MTLSPPKFKLGDMVIIRQGTRRHAHVGKVCTVLGLDTWPGERRYITDLPDVTPNKLFRPCESVLQLIRDGDLKLDEMPAELSKLNREKVVKWLEKELK